MRRFFCLWSLIGCFCVVVFLMVCGCEKDPKKYGLDTFFERNPYESANRPDVIPATEAGGTLATALSMSPESSELTTNGDMQTFVASGGIPPYTWTVLDAGLGHLLTGGATGGSVVYVRDMVGDNALKLEDGSGSVVIVVIDQP